jgi:hypothetical protein
MIKHIKGMIQTNAWTLRYGFDGTTVAVTIDPHPTFEPQTFKSATRDLLFSMLDILDQLIPDDITIEYKDGKN